MSIFGLEFTIHGRDLSHGLVDWLDEVTLLDFVLTVEAVGFSTAVEAVREHRGTKVATAEERVIIDTFTKDEFHEMNVRSLRYEWPKLFNAITQLVTARR